MISKDEAANLLKSRGYEVTNEKGVVTIHLSQGVSPDTERKNIREVLKEIQYGGSWGIRAKSTSHEEIEIGTVEQEPISDPDMTVEPKEEIETKSKAEKKAIPEYDGQIDLITFLNSFNQQGKDK